jgi:hypothetical protein
LTIIWSLAVTADMTVISYLTVSSYPARMVTRLPPLPAPGNAVCVAAAARCVLLPMRDHLELWRLGDSGTTTSGAIGTVLPLRTRRSSWSG